MGNRYCVFKEKKSYRVTKKLSFLFLIVLFFFLYGELKAETGDLPPRFKKWLDKGEYSVYIQLRNLSGDQKIKKLLLFKM